MQWRKTLFSTAFMIMVIFLFSASSWAAVPDRVKVTLTEGSAGKTNINLTWNWISGNQFSRSLGETWSTPLTGPGTIPSAGTLSIVNIDGQEVASYTENDFTNWNIVYFKLTDATNNSKRINVYPPIEHGHSNYSDNTDQCKVCHITHTATSAKLLSETSIKELCYTCHGGSIATGSRYNVEKGTTLYSGEINWTGDRKIKTSSPTPAFRKSLGGPFDALNDEPQWVKATSSSHEIEAPQKLAPGGGLSMTVTCTNCHNSHASNENYRLLKTESVFVDAYAKINPSAIAVTDFREVGGYFNNGMNQFCKSCHPQFQKGSGSGHTTSDSVYRHATEVPLRWDDAPTGSVTYTSTLPIYKDPSDNEEKIFCLTCHFAHGTVAQGNNDSINVPSPGGSTVLKRLDNMGVCEDCHKK